MFTDNKKLVSRFNYEVHIRRNAYNRNFAIDILLEDTYEEPLKSWVNDMVEIYGSKHSHMNIWLRQNGKYLKSYELRHVHIIDNKFKGTLYIPNVNGKDNELLQFYKQEEYIHDLINQKIQNRDFEYELKLVDFKKMVTDVLGYPMKCLELNIL